MESIVQPTVELVPMTLADIDAVLAIELRVCPFPWGRGNFVDSLASSYSCWVCRVGQRVAGYFVLMLAVDDAHLLSIGVSEPHQRKGYGARLLRHAMRVALENGARQLLLEVRPSNKTALAMYQHFGFEQIGVRRGYYPADGGREDALVLTHALGEMQT